MMRRVLVGLIALLFCQTAEAGLIKEDLAQSLTLWLFNTDGTPKTGVTVTTITVRYVKNDGTTASFSPTVSAGSNDMVEKGHGAYYQEFTAAQLDTAGIWEVGCTVSGGACAPTTYNIIPVSSFALCCEGNVATVPDVWNMPEASATAGMGLKVKTNVDQRISWAGGQVDTGTAQAGAASSITLSAGASGTVNYYRYKRIILLSGTGMGQSAIISAYNQTTKVATTFCEGPTAGAWFTNPDSTTGYIILPRNR